MKSFVLVYSSNSEYKGKVYFDSHGYNPDITASDMQIIVMDKTSEYYLKENLREIVDKCVNITFYDLAFCKQQLQLIIEAILQKEQGFKRCKVYLGNSGVSEQPAFTPIFQYAKIKEVFLYLTSITEISELADQIWVLTIMNKKICTTRKLEVEEQNFKSIVEGIEVALSNGLGEIQFGGSDKYRDVNYLILPREQSSQSSKKSYIADKEESANIIKDYPKLRTEAVRTPQTVLSNIKQKSGNSR